MYTVPLPARSPVICTSRMKTPPLNTVTGLCHVLPLSLEKVTLSVPPTSKSFQETYIRPNRLAFGYSLAVNTEMSPSSLVISGGGLIAAQAMTTAAPIQPDREPGGRRLVVQNNRIAKGVVEGALTVGLGEPREG